MPDAVEIAFHQAASRLLDGTSVTLVAVSGGGDSVALLHLMARLSPKLRPQLVVAHLDHGLRRGSGADRRFVEMLSASLHLPAIAASVDVRAERRKDESLEEAARRVRRAFLLTTARKAGAETIATGHTQDDQAETILMRLARGAGPSALAAMQPLGPGPFIKPLLDLERATLRAWLKKRRLPFRDDPSNESLAYDRNRVRRLVLPVLAKALNPAAARHLVEAANRLREDAMFLDAQAQGLFAVIAKRREDALRLEATALAALPRPLAARVARIALEAAGCDPRKISTRHVDAVLQAASGRRSSLDLPGRVVLSSRSGLLEFRPCVSPPRS